ncbi:MAG: hypothetical protein ACM3JG_09295 [Thiohalocapsa sp.]
MIAVPKIVVILVIAFAVWYAMRWLNRASPPKAARRTAGPRAAAPRQAAVEDLTACRICGAYVAPSARACGKPGCPMPA